MKVKKFNGADNHEAMMKVRQELGPDAVILHQRKIKAKGLFSYFKKPIIEIVAAVEEPAVVIPQPKATPKNEMLPPEAGLRALAEKKTRVKPDGELSKEIFEIKHMLSSVVTKVNRENLAESIKGLGNPDLENIFFLLKEQELEAEIIEEIMKELAAFVEGAEDRRNINKEALHGRMMKLIDQYFIERPSAVNSKVIFFVGPTGVGKTTTIAKLAAQFSINEGKQVGFISADTYRIAAVEQLKIYSEILDIPVEVIYEPGEIHSALERLQHKDIIMVDTAGRSSRNQGQMEELQLLLNQIEEKEIYLVISCTSKNKDIKEIIDAYQFLDDYKFIFTKLDEATTYGSILNTTMQTHRPVSFITTGQSVPDDIEVTDIEKVIGLLMKEA